MDAVGFNPRRFLFLKEKVDGGDERYDYSDAGIEETFMVKVSNRGGDIYVQQKRVRL